jgi:phosphoglycolate phosphatase
MRLVLFDIDGTLITTGHAGMRAYYRALGSVFSVSVDGASIKPDGKTDPLIAKELLACAGLAHLWSEDVSVALFGSYVGYLEEEMDKAKEDGQIRILPGVIDLLEVLSRQPDFSMGLVTGNLEKGAQIKLEKAGLGHFFRFGGYGSDFEDRTGLTRVGIERGIRFVAPAPVEAAFIIGDTPFDIIHGRAAGADVIAVASARYSLRDLEPYKPELLVPDLTQTDQIIEFMRCSPERWNSQVNRSIINRQVN